MLHHRYPPPCGLQRNRVFFINSGGIPDTRKYPSSYLPTFFFNSMLQACVWYFQFYFNPL